MPRFIIKNNSHYHSNKNILDNIEQSSLDDWNSKQTNTGDLRDNITTFSQSKIRTNIATGEKLSLTLGKIQKFLSDLKDIAFKNKVEKSDLKTELISEIEDKYTKSEVDNKFSTLESNLDWKESVYTFDDIAVTYPNPQDGWTVNTMDTNFTFRYNGKEWIAISANAIPKATQEVDGLLTKEDKKVLDANKNSRHEHTNKSVLDNINQTSIDKWNDTTATKLFVASNTDKARIQLMGTSDNNMYLEIATSDNGNEPIAVRQYHYNGDSSIEENAFCTVNKEAYLLDANGNTQFPGIVNAIGGFKQNGISLDNRYFQTFEIPSNFNLDTITQQGVYTTINNDTAKTVIGRPSDYAFSIISLVYVHDRTRVASHIQIANIYNNDSMKIRRRNYNTDTWGDWFEIITDKNKSQFAKKYLQEDGWNDDNAITGEMLPSQFPFGLSIYKVYKNAGFPSKFGNVISVRTSMCNTCQLFLGWVGNDNVTGNVYYRSARDINDAFGPWKSLVGTDNIISENKTLKVTTEWQDIDINLNTFESGTYIFQAYIDNADNHAIYRCFLSGVMSIYGYYTNSNMESDKNEIPLHQAAHATSGDIFHIRTCAVVETSPSHYTKLQIKYSGTRDISNLDLDCTFKFRKMI